MVAEAKAKSLPSEEVLIPKQEYSYNVRITQRIIKREVQVSMTFTFEGNLKYGYSGSEKIFDLESEDHFFEAESFIEATTKAWKILRHSDKRRDFVRDELVKKWSELKGQKLTHKRLLFNKDSDEIVIAS